MEIKDIIIELKKNKRFKESRQDEQIIKQCIDGLYTEKDFFDAVNNLFNSTTSYTLSPFSEKSVFIKFRNLNRDNYPEWSQELSPEDQYLLRSTYIQIIEYTLRKHNQKNNCDFPDILLRIYEYHKSGIPYWTISSCIYENINVYSRALSTTELLEFFDNGSRFKELCRKIFVEQKEFKKKKIPFSEIGIKI